MTRETDHSPPSTAAGDQAVEWHVRLTSDAAEEEDWLAFEAWLDEAPEHEAALREVERLWRELDSPREPGAVVTPLRRRARRNVWAWPAGLAASVALAVALTFTLAPRGAPPPSVYETAKGATREIALADGTRVRLNGGSHIAVSLGRRERRVEMADAEAAFDVARDPGRPFVIEAGDRRIRVLGTEFNVLHHAGRVTISVRRGIVEVRDEGAQPDDPPIARLARGQVLDHREGAAGDVVSSADPDRAFAWTQGRLVYEDARLEDVAADLNRYVDIPIVVAPGARDLRLTAVFELDKEDAMLRRLTGFLPVNAVRDGDVYRIGLRPR